MDKDYRTNKESCCREYSTTIPSDKVRDFNNNLDKWVKEKTLTWNENCDGLYKGHNYFMKVEGCEDGSRQVKIVSQGSPSNKGSLSKLLNSNIE